MYNNYDDNLAMKLKMLRIDAGLSQEEFATKMGISRSCVANYETGKRFPGISMIKKIAASYGIMTDALIGNCFYPELSMHESDPNYKREQTPPIHNNKLDISHLPVEHQISLIEYYHYLLANKKKAEQLFL